jgi:hypothetical protein
VPTGSPYEPYPYNYSEKITLLIERATETTVRQLISICEPCREDVTSAHDILNAILEDIETREELAAALGWMKLTRLIGPDGEVLIEPEDVLLVIPPDPIPRPVPESMIYQTGCAVWVGLNKVKL